MIFLEFADGRRVFLALLLALLRFLVEFFLEGVKRVLGLVQLLHEGGDLGVSFDEHVGKEILLHAVIVVVVVVVVVVGVWHLYFNVS